MKKIKFTLINILLSTAAMAQERSIDNLFDKYSDREGFTSVFISKYMFSLFANMVQEENEPDEFHQIVRGLESIRILTVEDSLLNQKLNFFTELSRELPLSQYKELMVVKEKGQDIRMLFREEKGIITEFLLISGGKENSLISITGNLDLKSIARLSKEMNVEGLDGLDKLNDRNDGK